MKKVLLTAITLASVIAMSFPVMAASPTASETLQPGVLGASRSSAADSAATEAVASALLKEGAIDTKAAATAVADSLAAIGASKAVDIEALKKECRAIYNSMTAEQKAKIDAAAAKRGISIEEAIGNFILIDGEVPGSVAVIWSDNVCKSSINGKAGSFNIILLNPGKDAVSSAIKDANGRTILSVFDFVVQDVKSFKTVDTAYAIQGVKSTDTAETIAAKQLVNGKWVNVKITGFANGGLALHITNKGPIKVERIK